MVCLKDDRPHGWEIAIARRSFKHGFKSYGWFDPNEKRYVAGDPHESAREMPDEVFLALIDVAAKYADRLNELEANAPRS